MLCYVYAQQLKLTLLSSHWYIELMCDDNTLSHLFWSIPIVQNAMYQVHWLISMTMQNCCTNANDLALPNAVGFFHAFDGGTLTTVALLNALKRLGAWDSSFWLQSSEAKASGVDAHSIDDFMVTHILFTSIWISQPRMVHLENVWIFYIILGAENVHNWNFLAHFIMQNICKWSIHISW